MILYIGDDAVDLSQSKVALSIKRIAIGDLSKRYISYSNSFKVPNTENNARLFGYPSQTESESTIPYSLLRGRLNRNGITIIPNAVIKIDGADSEFFNITMYEDDYDFFASIEGLKLSDINPIANTSWEPPYIDVARLSTDGVVTVLLNWGKSGAIYQQDYFLPCFYYHTLIIAILESTGLNISGAILTDARFTDLVIPFSGDFKYPEGAINTANGKALPSGNYTIPDLNLGDGDAKINIAVAEYGVDNFDFVDKEYISSGLFTYTIEAVINVNAIAWGDGTVLTFKIKASGSTLDSDTMATPTTSGTVTLTYTGTLLSTDMVSMTIASDATVGTAVTVLATRYLKVTCTNEIVRPIVRWTDLWPDISCKDLLRDFFMRFGIIPKQREETIYLETIENIILDKSGAVNWSSKVASKNNISFELGYAQNNLLNYKDSDEVKSPELGDGNIEVSNAGAEESRTMFTSLFENTNTEITSGYNVATIPAYDSTSTGIGTLAIKPKLKLLTIRDRVDEGAITFYVTPRTDYKLGYFVDQTQAKDTGWEYFLSEFYFSLEASLQKNKVITKFFYLTEVDIANYNPHKLIWDGYAYYLVNSIMNFVPGKLTKVELFKVV